MQGHSGVSDKGRRQTELKVPVDDVALTKLFADNAIPEMELVAHDPEDVNRLLDYMVNSK